MPSLRPSQITLQSRSDGGPFVEFLLLDGEGMPTDDVLQADSCEVYFSDVTADFETPHDRQLINQVENELWSRQWYECIDRETFGHAYRPLAQAGQHRQAYASAWSTAERATIERVINLMRDWDTDRCEMTVTLYAAWNDFILEGRPVTDKAIVDEVMHSWNDAKLRFDKGEWLAVLTEMKKHELLIPSGFGQRTIGGMLTLPGVE